MNTLSGQPGNWPAYEIVDIGKLKPAKRNARTHSDPQIDAVADSMREFSQIQTIVVDANYRIVAGHARWEAAKRLGLTRVAILRVEHLSEDQLRLYAIADNRIAELAGWANDILAVEFNELQVALPESNLSVSGFELPRIDVLTSKLEQTSWSDLDEVDEPSDEKHPISVAGDIWDFDDKHVLGNSDSTDAEFVRRVVGDEQVAVVATDPPFNLQGHEYSGNGRHQHGNFMQGAGEMSPEQFTAWLAAAIAAVRVLLAPGALLYMFMDWKHVRELLGAADRNGLTLLNICIWDKGKGGMGAFYRSAHEMVFVFRHGDAKHNNRIQLGRHGRDRTNLWRYEGMNRFGRGRDRALSMHATIKPVQMICDLLLDCTEKGDLIFDGFGGSGTSLIAAEKLGRRARIIELDPRWRALPVHYDDGGYSGGNLNRPAMQQLLADVDAGKLDVIVVYKVDRLTRSLMDFAKIVERLDARGVSFVSVTQAFNTTTSMGRLTLNVLLSFAQFEREVTGERIRDKIAASKAKGMWMGGNVPLGYDLRDRKLVPNPAEAEQVRHVFLRYLELKSTVKLVNELARDGVLTKRAVSRQGQERGGLAFRCGALCYLLQNRIYLGEIVHRGVAHAGEHEATVDKELFDAVQKVLEDQRQKRRRPSERVQRCWLAGLVRDGDGRQLTTSFSYGRGGRLYRYYVFGSLDPSRGTTGRVDRVPAAPLERLVLQSISKLLQSQVTSDAVLPLIRAIEIRDRSIQIVLVADKLREPHEPADTVVSWLQLLVLPDRLVSDCDGLRLIIDRAAVFHGQKQNCSAQWVPSAAAGAMLLKSAHELLRHHSMSPLRPEEHAQASAPAWQRKRRAMVLGLLAPSIQRQLLRGTVPAQMSCEMHVLPLSWIDQQAFLDTSNSPMRRSMSADKDGSDGRAVG